MRRAYHSSRGVLPTVVRRCFWHYSLLGAVAPKTNKTNKVIKYSESCFGLSSVLVGQW